MIAAMAKNRVIGVDNKLPWHLPADLQYFKQKTLGKPILMGRKTWESLPGVLPGRRHIVMTRDNSYQADGADVVHDFEQAKALVKDESELVITGGGELYRLLLPQADIIYLTVVDIDVDGDASFPELLDDDWELIKETPCLADERNRYDYRYMVYQRKS